MRGRASAPCAAFVGTRPGRGMPSRVRWRSMRPMRRRWSNGAAARSPAERSTRRRRTLRGPSSWTREPPQRRCSWPPSRSGVAIRPRPSDGSMGSPRASRGTTTFAPRWRRSQDERRRRRARHSRPSIARSRSAIWRRPGGSRFPCASRRGCSRSGRRRWGVEISRGSRACSSSPPTRPTSTRAWPCSSPPTRLATSPPASAASPVFLRSWCPPHRSRVTCSPTWCGAMPPPTSHRPRPRCRPATRWRDYLIASSSSRCAGRACCGRRRAGERPRSGCRRRRPTSPPRTARWHRRG